MFRVDEAGMMSYVIRALVKGNSFMSSKPQGAVGTTADARELGGTLTLMKGEGFTNDQENLPRAALRFKSATLRTLPRLGVTWQVRIRL